VEVTPAYEAVLAAGAAERHAEHVRGMRRAFEARTGAFTPEDPWFEARSRAFWDDAVTAGGFARHVAAEVAESPWVDAFGRAHRGLFLARLDVDADDTARLDAGAFGAAGTARLDAELWVLEDVWGGADFLVGAPGEGLREALLASIHSGSLLDGRVVARDEPTMLALLPGAVFHPADATEPIHVVLEAARARDVATGTVLDALLRMERNLRSLSRVKAAYAYRPDALWKP